MRILLVEDDQDLGDAIVRRLRNDGHAIDWSKDGREADEILQYQEFELVILDVGLPGMNGFALLRKLRGSGRRSSVLMLTARSDIEDRVTALDVGADDYMSKPFDFREFDARCRALLRRAQGVQSGETTLGDLVIDRASKSARLKNMHVHLPNREYRLLEILIGNIGRVMTKEQIASQLFHFDDDAGENAIELYIGRLRRKLGGALIIRTLRGIGYVAERNPVDGH